MLQQAALHQCRCENLSGQHMMVILSAWHTAVLRKCCRLSPARFSCFPAVRCHNCRSIADGMGACCQKLQPALHITGKFSNWGLLLAGSPDRKAVSGLESNPGQAYGDAGKVFGTSFGCIAASSSHARARCISLPNSSLLLGSVQEFMSRFWREMWPMGGIFLSCCFCKPVWRANPAKDFRLQRHASNVPAGIGIASTHRPEPPLQLILLWNVHR